MAHARTLGTAVRHRLSELRGPSWRQVAILRRTAAGLLAVLALVLAVAPAAGAGGAPILVAVRDLTAGAPVQAADLEVRRWPTELVPAGALRDVADADGRVLVGTARAGEPITDARLAGSGLAARLSGSPDAAAVPIRLSDPDVAALLVPGGRVDVVTAGERSGQPVVLAADAAVLAVLAPGTGAAGTAGRGRLVLVAMPRSVATRVAAAALAEQVAITLR